jgi:hypothetical protein
LKIYKSSIFSCNPSSTSSIFSTTSTIYTIYLFLKKKLQPSTCSPNQFSLPLSLASLSQHLLPATIPTTPSYPSTPATKLYTKKPSTSTITLGLSVLIQLLIPLGLTTPPVCFPSTNLSPLTISDQNTTSVVNAPGNQLGLYTTSTGFQYAYAAAGSGTIGNTLAHSDGVYPDDVYEGPWSQEGGQLKFEEKDFYACPFDSEAEPGTTPYRITGQGVGTPSIGQRCIDIAITLVPYTGLGAL